MCVGEWEVGGLGFGVRGSIEYMVLTLFSSFIFFVVKVEIWTIGVEE